MNAVTENAVSEMPAPLIFSDSAAGKVKQLIEEEGNPELKLRVFDVARLTLFSQVVCNLRMVGSHIADESTEESL